MSETTSDDMEQSDVEEVWEDAREDSRAGEDEIPTTGGKDIGVSSVQ